MVRIVVFLALAGCATTAESDPSIDPSSPRAEEAPVANVPELPRRDPTLAVRESPSPPSQPPQHPPATHPPATHPPAKPKPDAKPQAQTVYTCPMHPEVRSDKPGKCPKCGMTLVPEKKP